MGTVKEVPIERVSFFQGYVVTSSEDGSIPLTSIVIGFPIVGGTFVPGPGLAEADAVAVDRKWLVNFVNGMLSQETLSRGIAAENSDRIVELLENLDEVRGVYSDLKERLKENLTAGLGEDETGRLGADIEQGDQKDG
jgi:hypothetical protein